MEAWELRIAKLEGRLRAQSAAIRAELSVIQERLAIVEVDQQELRGQVARMQEKQTLEPAPWEDIEVRR